VAPVATKATAPIEDSDAGATDADSNSSSAAAAAAGRHPPNGAARAQDQGHDDAAHDADSASPARGNGGGTSPTVKRRRVNGARGSPPGSSASSASATPSPDDPLPSSSSSLAASTATSTTLLRVSVLHPSIREWRQGPLAGEGLRVFVRGSARSAPLEATITRGLRPQLPARPKKPMSSYFEFCRDFRAAAEATNSGRALDFNRVMSEAWAAASEGVRRKYHEMQEENARRHAQELAEYDARLAEFARAHPRLAAAVHGRVKLSKDEDPAAPRKLFNKVLRVLPKPSAENRKAWLRSIGSPLAGPPLPVERFTYFFVMTFVPDLNWCQLAPLVPDGVFPPSNKKKHERAVGRTRWKLAPETVASEIDVSASRCVVVRAYTMRGCEDADQEEWLIEDAGGAADDDDEGAAGAPCPGDDDDDDDDDDGDDDDAN